MDVSFYSVGNTATPCSIATGSHLQMKTRYVGGCFLAIISWRMLSVFAFNCHRWHWLQYYMLSRMTSFDIMHAGVISKPLRHMHSGLAYSNSI